MADTKNQTIVAFDLYGTLLSTESIAKKLASHFGEEKAGALAADWRKYQLEYTWRMNSMQQYVDFSTLTRRSLIHTLSSHSLSLPDSDISSLMKAYDTLSTFPDVSPALTALSKSPHLTAVVFSNGTQSMVSTSVYQSPDLSPHSAVFKDIVTVEEPKCFKPAPKVYEHLAKKMGKEGRMGEMWLVSGNPFDVVGARAAGMRAVWVDRGGGGWVDGLVDGEKGRPDEVCKSLEEVVEYIGKQSSK